jgi:hypothetical protein
MLEISVDNTIPMKDTAYCHFSIYPLEGSIAVDYDLKTSEANSIESLYKPFAETFTIQSSDEQKCNIVKVWEYIDKIQDDV